MSFKSVRSLAGSIKNDSGIVDEYINNAGTWEMAVQAGLNHGGSRENTDLSIVPGSEPAPESFIDFCPGATGTG